MKNEANPAVPELNCPFCHPDIKSEILLETGEAFALFDQYPVNPGHVLIIPRRHCADYFLLSSVEQTACWELANKAREILDLMFKPDGYTVGINNLAAAGQTVPHAHIHVIPRHYGDVPRPEGGIRGVIPGKQEYR